MELEKFLRAYEITCNKYGPGSVPIGYYLYGNNLNVWTKDQGARAAMAMVDKDRLLEQIHNSLLENVSVALSKHGIVTDNELMNEVMNYIISNAKIDLSIASYKDIDSIVERFINSSDKWYQNQSVVDAITGKYKILSYIDSPEVVVASINAKKLEDKAELKKQAEAKILNTVSEIMWKRGVQTDNEVLNSIVDYILSHSKEGFTYDGYLDMASIINAQIDLYLKSNGIHPLPMALYGNYKITQYNDDRKVVMGSYIADNYSKIAENNPNGISLFMPANEEGPEHSR